MISYHFLNQTSRGNFFTNDSAHGAGQLWSHIPDVPAFREHKTPFPLICADSRPVGSNYTVALPPDPIVYEVSASCSDWGLKLCMEEVYWDELLT
jgi:lysophospholipase